MPTYYNKGSDESHGWVGGGLAEIESAVIRQNTLDLKLPVLIFHISNKSSWRMTSYIVMRFFGNEDPWIFNIGRVSNGEHLRDRRGQKPTRPGHLSRDGKD